MDSLHPIFPKKCEKLLPISTITYLSKHGNIFSFFSFQPNDKILDVGCGIGGSAFYMAKNFGVQVYGYDLSVNMINIANDLRHCEPANVKHAVQFYVEDATLMVKILSLDF